jgi:hypothetical protein
LRGAKADQQEEKRLLIRTPHFRDLRQTAIQVKNLAAAVDEGTVLVAPGTVWAPVTTNLVGECPGWVGNVNASLTPFL